MSLGKTLLCSHCSSALVWLEQPPEAVPDPTWMSVYIFFSLLWSSHSISCSVYIPLSITPVTLQRFCRNLDFFLYSQCKVALLCSTLCLSLAKGDIQTLECISALFSALWAWMCCGVCMLSHWKVWHEIGKLFYTTEEPQHKLQYLHYCTSTKHDPKTVWDQPQHSSVPFSSTI